MSDNKVLTRKNGELESGNESSVAVSVIQKPLSHCEETQGLSDVIKISDITLNDVTNPKNLFIHPTLTLMPPEQTGQNSIVEIEMESLGNQQCAINNNGYYDDILNNAMSQIITDSPSQFQEVDEQNPKFRQKQKKKEKKRTECINHAFSELRRRIPNVPVDTKLSKIKTLRLATSYITYLTEILKSGDPTDFRDCRDFRADLKALRTRERRKLIRNINGGFETVGQPKNLTIPLITKDNDKSGKRGRGRTGWPQAVWAMNLNPVNFNGPINNNMEYYDVPPHQIYEVPHEYYEPPQTQEITYFSPIDRSTNNEPYHDNGDNYVQPYQSQQSQNDVTIPIQPPTYQWVPATDYVPKPNPPIQYIQELPQFPTEFFDPTPMTLPPISLPPANEFVQAPNRFQQNSNPDCETEGGEYNVDLYRTNYTVLQTVKEPQDANKGNEGETTRELGTSEDSESRMTYITL